MGILSLICLVMLAGAVGGLVNCAIEKEFSWPHFDAKARVWRPGWLGSVLVGAIAALAVWGIYGPLATYDFAKESVQPVSLTVSQLVTSLIVGLSGGKILTLMAQKTAERVAKDKFAGMLKESLEKQSGDEPPPEKP